MYGMMDIENPMELEEIRLLYKLVQETKFNYMSANALCILWIAFSETVPGTTCLKVEDDTMIGTFIGWIESGEEHPY